MKNKVEKNYILIPRDLLEDAYFSCEKYTKLHALIDLFCRESWSETTYKGHKIPAKIIAVSQRKFGEKWGWSKDQVYRFIKQIVKKDIARQNPRLTRDMGCTVLINPLSQQKQGVTKGAEQESATPPATNPATEPANNSINIKINSSSLRSEETRAREASRSPSKTPVKKSESIPYKLPPELERLFGSEVDYPSKVRLDTKGMSNLLKLMGDQELKYWVTQLEDYLHEHPRKSYKDHYRVIRRWRLRALEENRVWDGSKYVKTWAKSKEEVTSPDKPARAHPKVFKAPKPTNSNGYTKKNQALISNFLKTFNKQEA